HRIEASSGQRLGYARGEVLGGIVGGRGVVVGAVQGGPRGLRAAAPGLLLSALRAPGALVPANDPSFPPSALPSVALAVPAGAAHAVRVVRLLGLPAHAQEGQERQR